jgi:RHS repeat-associated protein
MRNDIAMPRQSGSHSLDVVRWVARRFFPLRTFRCWILLSLLSGAAFAQCTFTVSSGGNAYVDSSGAVDLAGDPLVIQVTASAQTCAWTADATDGFATISGANSGTGNGSVTYTIPANPSSTAARTTTLNVAGNAITLKQNATLTTFQDVLPNDPRERFYFDGINFLAAKKITGGTSTNPPLYSPAQNVTRGQMAVFIISTIFNASGNNFTYSTTPYFSDVLPSNPFFKFVQKMRDLGIAAGETATTYGPNDPVTRAQMAVFITLARLGPQTAFTYSSTPQFGDVPASNPFFKFVQKLAEMGITAGCTAASGNTLANYCPDNIVTRDQMAVFLIVGGFNLLEPNAPAIISVSPNSGTAGSSVPVTITGINTHFDATTTILTTAGITASAPTSVTATSLQTTLTIPSGTPLGQISLTTETPDANGGAGEEATLPNGFTVGSGAPVPTISSFTPTSGPIGTMVTLTGTGLQFMGTPVAVLVPLQGGGTTSAPVTSFTGDGTSIGFVIPSTAASGSITLTSSSGSVKSPTAFTIVPSSTYTISAAPSTANLIAGQSTTYTITAASANGFTGLASLSLLGLPSGLTATFNPIQITAGQQSTLTITAPSNQSTNTATLAINASATVDGLAVPAAATATLNVMPISTSFLGRTVVDDGSNTSLAGVVVTMVGMDGAGNKTSCTGSTTSDGSGNFAFTNLPAGCLGPQLIGFNGNTVTSPAGKYAGLQLVFTLVANTVVVSPVLVHLPRVDNVETFSVTQNATADQSYSFKSIPGLSVTVYAGTVFTEQDGTQPNPFPLAAIEVPVDRLPDVMPSTTASVTAFIVAFQPAETNASKAVAVWFPNTLNTPPGTDVPLTTLDPTLGRMTPYGTGTISSDGTTIIPDIDPSTGTLQHRYGIVHFDWHGPSLNPPPSINPPCGCNGNGPGNSPAVGGAVDLSSGIDTLSSTDLVLHGNRGSVSIERTYRTLSTQLRAFGIGSSFNYDYRLDTLTPQSDAVVNLEFPDGVLAPFTRQADGTMINQTAPILRGAVMTTAASGTSTLRFKSGTTFTFVPGWRLSNTVLTAITDANGNTISIVRNSSDQRIITEIDDPVGRRLTFTWNSMPAIASITDPIGRTVSYTYAAGGSVATFTNVLGGVTKYTYDSQNRLLTVTDPRGVVTEANTYDANGRVAAQVNAAGGTLTFAPAVSGAAPAVSGAAVAVPVGYGLINPLVPTSPVQQASYMDPLGNVTTYRFNAQGYVIEATDATGQTRTITRASGTNLVLSMTGSGTCPVCGDSKVGDVTLTYDAYGNVLTQTDGLGDTWTFTYDPVFNHVTSATDPLGNVTAHSYDVRGNLIRITDARGNSKVFTRDANGLVTAVQDEVGNVLKLTYDPLGNLISASNPLGQTTRYSYDGASRPIAKLDPLGRTSTVAYNPGDQATMLTDGNGHTTQLVYDAAGFPLSLTDANGGKTSLAYDSAGRLSSRTDPSKRVISYRYDVNNNIVGFTNRRGEQAVYAYDPLNRIMTETYADANVKRTYDSSGRLVQTIDSQSGTFSRAYDLAGHLIKEVGPNGTIAYSRDADGRVASRQVGGQSAVNYTYDGDGNLTAAVLGSTSITRTYDARNLLATNVRSNGVAGSYMFDSVGRILNISEQAGGNTLFSRAFTYDAAGQTTGAALDKGLALSTAAASGTFDAANEVTSFGGIIYTSDADGNRLTERSAAGTTSYVWDARGRLQAIQAPGGIVTAFVYDPNGQMIQKRVTSTGEDNLQQYILDDVSNIVSVQQGESANTSVVDGRVPDDIMATVQGGSAVFPLFDQIGSEGAFTDASGNAVGRQFYEPYGVPAASGVVGLFQFTGKPLVNTGLYYDRARFYDSGTGRFISEDPLALSGLSPNPYSYVHGDPISRSDPNGFFDIFGFGALTGTTDTPVRPAAEAVGLVGYDSNSGWYGGDIFALGGEIGSHENYFGSFAGVETTTDCPTPKAIALQEINIGVEIPFLGGVGIGGGVFNTAKEGGFFFFIGGGVIGQYGSLGFGFSAWKNPVF